MSEYLILENNGLQLNLFPDQLLEVERLAGLAWGLSRIARYLGIPLNQFEYFFNQPDSELKYHYMRGLDISQAKIDMALLKEAETGNLTASAIMNKKLRETKYQIRKQQILYAG